MRSLNTSITQEASFTFEIRNHYDRVATAYGEREVQANRTVGVYLCRVKLAEIGPFDFDHPDSWVLLRAKERFAEILRDAIGAEELVAAAY
jgi:hypothetical protein